MKNIIKIYERRYDNPFYIDCTPKENKLLGEFEIIETLSEDFYSSQRIGVMVGTSKVYLINEYEVSGHNGGSRFEIKEIKSLTVKKDKDMTNKEIKKYCLFSGRHELPENQGSIFSSFNFESFEPIKTDLYYDAVREIEIGGTIGLYITGLTPALTYFLKEIRNMKGKVVLLHFSAESKEYIEQMF